MPSRIGPVVLLVTAIACGAGGGDDDGSVVDGGGAAHDAAGGGDASTSIDGGLVAPIVHDYIRSDEFTRLVVEIDAVAGMEPRASVEADIVSELDQILDKPAGITTTADGAIASRGADHAWTNQELFELADQHHDLAVGGETTKIHSLFVDGHSARDSADGVVLGLAWANRHLVIFEQTVRETCAGQGLPPLLEDRLCEGAERAIWTHEIGHVIGLVDNGLPMVEDHRDPDHGHHDVDDACVMYWAYQGDQLVTSLADRLTNGGDAELSFDAACLADIEAVREGG